MIKINIIKITIIIIKINIIKINIIMTVKIKKDLRKFKENISNIFETMF